jgi:D-alanine-D-alanine ligase
MDRFDNFSVCRERVFSFPLFSQKKQTMRTVVIFCGGFSSEWEISLKSAQTIKDNFPEDYRVFRVLISNEGWFAEVDGQQVAFSIETMTFDCNGELVKPDAALIYVHGDPGENGRVQALLDMKRLPYINSGPLASELSFDKWFCNQFLKGFGVKVAESVLLNSIEELNVGSLTQQLGLPIFVKPADSGSSFGISKVKSLEEIVPAFQKAFAEGGSVVAEAFLDGTEVTCGVYRGRNGLHALPLTEIASENEFFDYEAKYLGKSKEITPARVADDVRIQVQEQAKFVYQLLKLRSIARIDFMIVKGVPYVIEVNTTPGFSPASIVPQMIACEGRSIKEFWAEILDVELHNG